MQSIPTCSCRSKRRISGPVQTDVTYNEQAGGEICIYCSCYPVYVVVEKETSNSNWREEFNQDLKSLLATWDLEPDDEFSSGQEWLLELINKGA
jgi:hypothetical protein